MERGFKILVLNLLWAILSKSHNTNSDIELWQQIQHHTKYLSEPCEVCNGTLPSQVFVYCARCGRKL